MTLVRLQSNGDYWQAAWSVPGRARPMVKSLGSKAELSRPQALEKCQEIATQHANDPATIAAAEPERVTFKTLSEIYRKERGQSNTHAVARKGYRKSAPKLTDSTIDEHAMTIRYLIKHFGNDRILRSIDDNAVEEFIGALEAGKLSTARKPGLRTFKIGPQTMRKHIRQAKAIFAWAKLKGFVLLNPFADFDGTPLASEPNADVAAATIEQVIDACPNHSWTSLFGLCRFAGLRLGEALTMPWSGEAIDKKGERRRTGLDMLHRRIHVVAEKTGMYRVVPMSPRLYEILKAAKDACPAGQAQVCDGIGRANVTHTAKTILKEHKIKPWPKLFQALRSSCENEWKVNGVAEATYAAWLGHGIAVSRAHYASPTEAEYQTITQLRIAG